MSRARRFKPHTREGRKRAAELGRIISSPRTLKADREAALRELDSIAPVLGSVSRIEDSKPTREDLERLIERVEAKQASGSLSGSSPAGESASDSGTPAPVAGSSRSILSAEEIRAKVDAWTHQLVPYARENVIRKAKSAPDSERAAVLLAELPDHRLNVLARELATYLWQQDLSRPRPDAEQIARGIVRGWLEKRPYNQADLRGHVEPVADAVADIYRLLAERDAENPIWYVRRAEEVFDATQSAEPKPELVASPMTKPDTAPPDPPPVVLCNLGERVDFVLRLDPNLSKLATYSSEYDVAIRAAITRQLREHGFADGAFLAGLYNASRPKNLSAFPPRTF